MNVHSLCMAEELEDEGSDLVFPEPEPRSLAASAHILDSGRDLFYQVTYRLATNQQIKGLFRRKRPVGICCSLRISSVVLAMNSGLKVRWPALLCWASPASSSLMKSMSLSR